MICADQLCKMVQLVPLQESNAFTIAEKFLSMVVSQQELLECISRDCDPKIHGHFWDELMSLLDITLTFSIVLQPQTNSWGNEPYYRIAITDTHIIEETGWGNYH